MNKVTLETNKSSNYSEGPDFVEKVTSVEEANKSNEKANSKPEIFPIFQLFKKLMLKD